jgi:hypothetical protein
LTEDASRFLDCLASVNGELTEVRILLAFEPEGPSKESLNEIAMIMRRVSDLAEIVGLVALCATASSAESTALRGVSGAETDRFRLHAQIADKLSVIERLVLDALQGSRD